jgi:hypothetical protein
MEKTMGSLYTFPILLRKRWQRKLSKLSQNFFDLFRNFPIAPRIYLSTRLSSIFKRKGENEGKKGFHLENYTPQVQA